ncbi:MAG: hypothetical protein H6686_01300 [Fibrobacteria bacterium]|nr:hypothetical protein [Fibrobacteria bacterium]
MIDHRHAVLKDIPLAAIQQAKDSLHVAFGHTSHGSQLLCANGTGSAGLNALAGVDGVYATSPEGRGGTLHVFEGSGYQDNGHLAGDWMTGDAGWDALEGATGLRFVGETREFLGSPDAAGRGSRRPDFNVVMWAWCGQVSWHGDEFFAHYLSGMDSLRAEYRGVTFVLMTGHLDGTGSSGQLHRRNQTIRGHAREHGYWLYDFADLDRFDPDGNDYLDRGVTDGADYDSDGDGTLDANWARAWTETHPSEVGTGFEAEHTEPLAGQIKTVAAWWLFASLAGWGGSGTPTSAIRPAAAPAPSGRPLDALGRRRSLPSGLGWTPPGNTGAP